MAQFNQEKYKKIFEQRFGKGSYNKGLSRASEIGKAKASVGIEKEKMNMRKDAYKDYLKEIEKAQKEAEKAAEKKAKESAKITEANKKKQKQVKKAHEQGRGGFAPSREQQMKEREIQSDLKSKGKVGGKIQKQLDALPNIDKSVHEKPKTQTKAANTKKKKDDEDGGFLKDITTPLKYWGKGVKNIFDGDDKTTFTGAFKEATEEAKNTKRSKVTQEANRLLGRAVDGVTGGTLEEIGKANGSGIESFYNKRDGIGGVADFVADTTGLIVPGGAAVKGAKALGKLAKGTKTAEKIGSSKLAKSLDKLPAPAKKVGKLGAEGATAGMIFGGAQSLGREAFNGDDYTLKDHAKNIALDTTIGMVADPALYGIGKGIKKGMQSEGFQNVLSKIKKPNTQTNAPLNASKKQQDEFIKEANDIPKGAESDEPQQLRLFLQNFNSNPDVTNPLDGVRAKVDRPAKQGVLDKLKTNAKEFASTARTQFVDDLAPLESLEKRIRGTVSSAEDSLYKTGRLFRGSPERAHEVVRQKLSPIVQDAKAAGYNMEDLGDYALAKHGEDVNSKGINSGFTEEQIAKTLTKYESPKIEELRQRLVQVSDDILKEELVDSGILSQEAYQTMREKWPNYMPMFRSFDDDKVEFSGGLSNALANAQNPIKRLEGSDRDVIDPIESMVKNIFQATTQADRNRVGKQLAKLATDDAEGNFIKKLAPNEETGRKNVISVFENGEKVKYEVPPEIYSTMKNLDQESTNTLVKILQKPASTLRAGATLTPEFSLRNPMRDIVQAYVVSKSGFNPVVDFPVGLWNAMSLKVGKWTIKEPGELYKQFVRDNGGYGNIVSMDRELHRTVLEKVLKENDNPKFINIINPAKWLDVLRAIADVSESATKVGEYRAALRSGTSTQEAAYRARDIMDFGRAGTSIREANKVVAFLNANIQGKSKLLRAIQEDPKGTTARAFKLVTMPTIAAYLAQKYMSNEEQQVTIDDAPQWLKDTFWLVPVPGTNQVARIPKPFDLAPPFANMVERALDFAVENDPDAFDNFARESFSSYSIPVMLTGLAPIVEGMANYSFFRQGPIIPMREQDMEFPDQHDVNTSETAKLLGKGINTLTGGEGAFKNFGSPRVVDNSIRGFFGGLGEYSTDAIDSLIINPIQQAMGTDDGVEKPDNQINQQPVLRSFLVNQSSTGESVGKIYDLVEKLKKQKGSDSAEFDQSQYQQANNVAKQISDITKQMREIENSPDLSGEEKRKQLDELNRQRNEIARAAAQQLK